jgi:hypothetical protein
VGGSGGGFDQGKQCFTPLHLHVLAAVLMVLAGLETWDPLPPASGPMPLEGKQMTWVSIGIRWGRDGVGLLFISVLDPLPAIRMFSLAVLFANYTPPHSPRIKSPAVPYADIVVG